MTMRRAGAGQGDETRGPVFGFDVPAVVGMPLDEVATPALLVDLDALERNIVLMGRHAREMGVRLRVHAKTHKSVDIARLQMRIGGASGVCCQKVSEAEVFVAAGIGDVLVSNQVVDPAKIERLVRLTGSAKIQVCVDDAANVDALSAAAARQGAVLDCLVEMDVGSGRCGTAPGGPTVALARHVAASPGLRFAGLQAYRGSAQHVRAFSERARLIDEAVADVVRTVAMLKDAGLDCPVVTGAGTGTYRFEGLSGVYTELQCGSYVFMDADYQQVLDERGAPISDFGNSLFVWTQVMSKGPGKAICDAGLKAYSVDSGFPVVHGRSDLSVTRSSDEHSFVADPQDTLALTDKLMLVPGHCDPTCALHDWYVGIRKGVVECVWPVSTRGLML